MKILASFKTHSFQAPSTESKEEDMAKKVDPLTKARSILKKSEGAHTPSSIKRKLKPKERKK